MPLPDGALTNEEVDQVLSRLITLWAKTGGKKPCRSCGEPSFFVHPALIANRSDSVNATGAHTRQPTVMVYCQQCGLAEHYVAKMLGIEVLQVSAEDGAK